MARSKEARFSRIVKVVSSPPTPASRGRARSPAIP